MSVLRGYTIFRSRFFDVVVLTLVTILLVHQVWADGQSYPQKYRTFATIEAPSSIAHPTIARYLELVGNLSDVENLSASVEQLYASELYYSDTFMVAHKRAAVLAHFAGLRDAGTELDVVVHDVLTSEQGTYLVWSADNTFSVLGRATTASSIGVTFFVFDEDGRIEVQQDFWDSTEGFYQHLPVIGGVLRTIRDEIGAG